MGLTNSSMEDISFFDKLKRMVAGIANQKYNRKLKEESKPKKMKKEEYENMLDAMKYEEKRMMEPILNFLEKVYMRNDTGSIQDILTYIDNLTRKNKENRDVVYFYLKSVIKAFLESLYPGDIRFSQILEKEHEQKERETDSDDTMSEADSSNSTPSPNLPPLYKVLSTRGKKMKHRSESIIHNLLRHYE